MTQSTPRHAAPRTARRGLTAAGVLSLALSGGAFALASSGTANAASATGQYNCKVSDLGLSFKTPWTVTLNANLPSSVAPGASIPGPKISAHVVTGSDSADLLRNQQIAEGTSTAKYTVAGAARSADLAVTGLPYTVPATGGITTDASGTGQAETAPTTPGTVKVVAGDFTVKLTMKSGFVANLACTPANGAGITLGTITVGSTKPTTPTTKPTTPTTKPTTPTTKPTTKPTTPTTKPTTPTTKPTTPTTKPTTPAPTDSSTTPKPTGSSSTPTAPKPTDTTKPQPTHTSTTAAPAPTSATTPPADTTGPKVDTDFVHGDAANTAGFALAAAGFVALGGAVVVGRRNGA